MLRCFCDTSAPFSTEGADLMNMEFRRESATYYSILSLIAEGHTSIGEIESVMKTPTSAYLRNLEINYSLLERVRPIFASIRSQGVRYRIADNFMLFWFRFIYPYQGLVSMQRSYRLLQVVEQGYNQFIGLALERYFRQQYMEEGGWTKVGGWWDNRGTNEIALVAVDDIDHKICIAEVKMQKERISLPLLETKAEKLKPHFHRYAVEYKALSVDDM
jgi:AAA+ ATPase superfamily predicted ATPase